MSEVRLDEFLGERHASIIAAVSARMRGDAEMTRVADQRRLREGELSEQVLGFWLEGIRSDLALGSTVAMEQNLEWLTRLREGHGLLFSDAAVARCFRQLSDEIESGLESADQRTEYAMYKNEVEKLISLAFPESGDA